MDKKLKQKRKVVATVIVASDEQVLRSFQKKMYKKYKKTFSMLKDK